MASATFTQSVVLVREVVSAMPDGNSVKKTEFINAEITFSYKPRMESDAYTDFGGWRIVARAPEATQ